MGSEEIGVRRFEYEGYTEWDILWCIAVDSADISGISLRWPLGVVLLRAVFTISARSHFREGTSMERKSVSRSMLTRKRAIMAIAIPKQISHFINSLQSPDWGTFSKSEAWRETIENLQLTREDQKDYRAIWEFELQRILRKHNKTH